MSSYCLKCRKDIEHINPRVSKTINGKAMFSPKCALCGVKKARFIKKQEAKGLVSSLTLETPLRKGLLLGEILF